MGAILACFEGGFQAIHSSLLAPFMFAVEI